GEVQQMLKIGGLAAGVEHMLSQLLQVPRLVAVPSLVQAPSLIPVLLCCSAQRSIHGDHGGVAIHPGHSVNQSEVQRFGVQGHPTGLLVWWGGGIQQYLLGLRRSFLAADRSVACSREASKRCGREAQTLCCPI